ncbi:MAG: STAS domain-containing protein [Fibrobacterota bacterium]
MLKTREFPTCIIIDLPERIIKGPDGARVRQELEAFGDKGKNLGINLSRTDYIDSSLVTVILNLDRRIKQAGKTLYIIHPSEAILEILNITSIARIIPVLDSEECLVNGHD